MERRATFSLFFWIFIALAVSSCSQNTLQLGLKSDALKDSIGPGEVPLAVQAISNSELRRVDYDNGRRISRAEEVPLRYSNRISESDPFTVPETSSAPALNVLDAAIPIDEGQALSQISAQPSPGFSNTPETGGSVKVQVQSSNGSLIESCRFAPPYESLPCKIGENEIPSEMLISGELIAYGKPNESEKTTPKSTISSSRFSINSFKTLLELPSLTNRSLPTSRLIDVYKDELLFTHSFPEGGHKFYAWNTRTHKLKRISHGSGFDHIDDQFQYLGIFKDKVFFSGINPMNRPTLYSYNGTQVEVIFEYPKTIYLSGNSTRTGGLSPIPSNDPDRLYFGFDPEGWTARGGDLYFYDGIHVRLMQRRFEPTHLRPNSPFVFKGRLYYFGVNTNGLSKLMRVDTDGRARELVNFTASSSEAGLPFFINNQLVLFAGTVFQRTLYLFDGVTIKKIGQFRRVTSPTIINKRLFFGATDTQGQTATYSFNGSELKQIIKTSENLTAGPPLFYFKDRYYFSVYSKGNRIVAWDGNKLYRPFDLGSLEYENEDVAQFTELHGKMYLLANIYRPGNASGRSMFVSWDGERLENWQLPSSKNMGSLYSLKATQDKIYLISQSLSDGDKLNFTYLFEVGPHLEAEPSQSFINVSESSKDLGTLFVGHTVNRLLSFELSAHKPIRDFTLDPLPKGLSYNGGSYPGLRGNCSSTVGPAGCEIDVLVSLDQAGDGEFSIPYSHSPDGSATVEGNFTISYSAQELSAEQNLLLVYNANSPESVEAKNYYLAHRPGAQKANQVAINCTSDEYISSANFTRDIQTPIEIWLANNSKKNIHSIVLFGPIPTLFSDYTPFANPDEIYPLAWSVDSALSKARMRELTYALPYGAATEHFNRSKHKGSLALVTRLDMGSLEATKKYIDKLKWMHSQMPNSQMPTPPVLISAEASGNRGKNYHLDDYRAANFDGIASYALTEILSSKIQSIKVILHPTSGLENVGAAKTLSQCGTSSANACVNLNANVTNAHDVGAYFSWGAYAHGYNGDYAIDGTVRFSGKSSWYLIQTAESFSGRRASHLGNYVDWFSKNAFGSSDYEYTPVGAVTYAFEPYTFGFNRPFLYSAWEQGQLFSEAAWASAVTLNHVAFGDPWVVK